MQQKRLLLNSVIGAVLLLAVVSTMGLVLLLESKQLLFEWASNSLSPAAAPFPVSVDPHTKTITEDPSITPFLAESVRNESPAAHTWRHRIAATLVDQAWYQNLASSNSRVIVIWPGERKEEVTKKIGGVLRWSAAEQATFQQLMADETPALTEGTYFPGQYVTHRNATPAEVSALIHHSFAESVLERYTPEVAESVPLAEALIIASLLEREASDFTNMREVSGVIWNRLFIDMPLQLDATLQYIKGSQPQQTKWWPPVTPADKQLASAYNTYQHTGLPPAPIANPSVEAIVAALNPIVTNCLYYFHTSDEGYHCSATYQDHVNKLRALYGRGS